MIDLKGKTHKELMVLGEQLDKDRQEVLNTISDLFQKALENYANSDYEGVVKANEVLGAGVFEELLKKFRRADGSYSYYNFELEKPTYSNIELIEKLVSLNFVKVHYYYNSEAFNGTFHRDHEFDDKEDRDSCFELEDGVKHWCDPMAGVVVSKEVFDESCYEQMQFTSFYKDRKSVV